MIVPSGIRSDVVVALSLHPTPATLRGTTRRLAHILEQHPGLPAELAAVESAGSRIALTVTVSLGSTDDVKAGVGRSREATRLLARLARELAHADPVLVPVPDPAGPGAARARRLMSGLELTVDRTAVDTGSAPASS